MKLYTMPGTCALAPNITAQWVDAPVEIHNLKRGEHREPAYLAINPKGQVPALEVEPGVILTEASAILIYIAQTAPSDTLNPSDLLIMGRINEALSFMTSEVHADYVGHFVPGRFAETAEAQEQVKQMTYQKLEKHYARLDQTITKNGSEWYLGHQSIADSYLYVLTRWISTTPLLLDNYLTLKAFKEKMDADPLVQKALLLQGMA